jgi:hypothetical protein
MVHQSIAFATTSKGIRRKSEAGQWKMILFVKPSPSGQDGQKGVGGVARRQKGFGQVGRMSQRPAHYFS